MVDRGSNGTIAGGTDCRVLNYLDKTVDLNGIDDHTVGNLQMVTAATKVKTSNGWVILILHQAAYMPDGRTILSTGQMEDFGVLVNDKPKRVTNLIPFLQLNNGYRVPITIRKGLPYVDFHKYTDDDWDSLPHIELTSPHPYDPYKIDSNVPDSWYDIKEKELQRLNRHSPFDAHGNLKEDPTPIDEEDDEDYDDRKRKGITRKEIRAYFHDIIRDEIDEDIDTFGTILTGYGETPDQTELNTFPVRRSARNKKKPIPYAPAAPRSKKKGKRKKRKQKTDGLEYYENERYVEGHDSSSNTDSDSEVPDLLSRDDDSSSDEEPDLGYNNPAKDGESHETIDRSHMLPKPGKRNIAKYGKYFPGVPTDTLKKTFQATTQLGTRGAIDGTTLRDQIKSPNPVLNIPRRHEDVATDTLYSSVPAVGSGAEAAQFFIGRRSHYRSVYAIGKTDKNMVHALMDEIRRYGAMDRLISDNAKAQISLRVKEIQRIFAIDDWQNEPYRSNQNFAETGWSHTKEVTQSMMNQKNAPGKVWLDALEYVCDIQNHVALKRLGWRTPIEWLLGYTPDISVFLQFEFYEPVYYQVRDAKFPGDTTEKLGRFIGITKNVGHAMTFKILTENDQIIARSVVRSAVKGDMYTNKRADDAAPELAPKVDLTSVDPTHTIQVDTVDDDGEDTEDNGETSTDREGTEEPVDTDPEATANREAMEKDILTSLHEKEVEEGAPLPTLRVESLLGRTFIEDPKSDGEQRRAKIVSFETTGTKTPDKVDEVYRFRCKVGENTFDEVMTYNKMLEWCDRDLDKDDMYKIEGILDHDWETLENGRRQLRVLVDWATGQKTWEPYNRIMQDDPVTLALYAKKHKLLGRPEWRGCRKLAKTDKRLARMVCQAKLRNHRNRPRYKYGFQVPRDHHEAMMIDELTGTTKWAEAEGYEFGCIEKYDVYKDLGKHAKAPDGYTKIPCHFVYDIKPDGRHRARFVAGGHRTDIPNDSTYSGVVSILGVRTISFLAELNGLSVWGTDIDSAYLQSFTKEKVYFVAGPEFGERAGHTFIVIKALYGLRTSGQRWHDRLYDVLTAMGFFPSRADPDIWMRAKDDHYEYIGIYVDDLEICSKDPAAIIHELEQTHKFKLKGTGELEFHLGCNFFRDEEGVLCFGPRKYIERTAAEYERMFGQKPKTNVSSPLEKNDHPELDTSPLLDIDGITKYQSLIGALQWTITLGRFDVGTAVMTMSGYRVAPRVGHLDRVRRIVGYLVKMKHGFVRIRTDEPDYSALEKPNADWSHTVYGKVTEELPKDAPKPLGKRVVHTCYVDANLQHDLTTGRSVTGVLHFFNQTPIEWFSKKQATVETATYGSEFIAAKTAVQQSMGLRAFLRYLGVEVHGPTHMFGDNGSVVTSGSMPLSPLKKRHLALAYHYTREAVASDAIDFQFLPGQWNPADILSKHWGYAQVWPLLQPILFWQGDTAPLLLAKDTRPSKRKGSDESSTSKDEAPAP